LEELKMEALLIQLVTGAVGGNLAGAVLKKFSLGTIWNSVVGILGGGIGSQVLGGLLSSGLVGDIASGGIGGAVLMIVVGVVKKLIAK
jgi:uncharacterized membrane protein YeaQ/YmgE (transglycosylase-associated protein family)